MDLNMSVTECGRIIGRERGNLFNVVQLISGRIERDGFMDAFDGAALRYRAGRIEQKEFRGIVHELTRDAYGTAAGQDVMADTVRAEREFPARRTAPVWLLPLLVFLSLVFVALIGYGVGESTGSDRQADMINGSYATWEVRDACDQGPRECHETLSRVNARMGEMGLMIMEDGSMIPR